MSMVVNHNISAFNTLRNLNNSNRMMSKSLQKLSSGYRINVGADGPADLIISEQLRAQSVGLQRAVRNTQEAMNVIGIAEGALTEMNEILKSMRQLTLHAANNGITSPEQVAADQSEVDSSVQTIDRIANTTKYSTQFLLNGSLDLSYDRDTTVDKSTDHSLLDLSQTHIEQVFKLSDFTMNIAFNGSSGDVAFAGGATAGAGNDPGEREAYTDGANQARRAFMEAESGVANTDIDTTDMNTLSAKQRFTITGSQGSRSFDFSSGTHLGEVANAINNVADSIGVSAQLIFDSTAAGTAMDTTVAYDATTARDTGEINTYHMDSTYAQKGNNLVNQIEADLSALVAGDLEAGRNLDGDGRMWVKWDSATAFEVYKDRDMTMKIGEGDTGVNGGRVTFIRDAGLASGATIDISVANGAAAQGDVTMLQFAQGIEFDDNMVDASQLTSAAFNLAADADDGDTLSGVRLGYNTDANGKLYFKLETGAADGNLYVYKDSAMKDEDLVASSENITGIVGNDRTANLTAVNLGGGAGPTSNLYGSLNFTDTSAANSTYTGEIGFERLGVRLYSNEYGAEEFVKVEAQEGSLWSYYSDADDNTTGTLLDSSGGSVSTTVYGQDATLMVNGRELTLDQGTGGTVTTQDLTAQFKFNRGEIGMTTIAQVGYDVGGLYSKAQDVNDVGSAAAAGNWATNAMNNTSEVLSNFTGGMQFQLGEGDGDQERTVFAVQSMAVTQLGATNFYDDFGQGLKETKELSLQDVLGGGLASLASDPVKALSIIDRAIEEVSSTRARLGAFQKNMLQTNMNSLNVAIENITSTESDIRDANMAQETTEFTKNQILVAAGTAMLAQANVASQNVLQLLG